MVMHGLRVGHGYDIHRTRPGGRLRLAGVEVSSEISVDAHSDGDVVLHALIDALLGATGQGDIGLHFLNSDPSLRGADSTELFNRVWKPLAERQVSFLNIDVTILAERPRLGPFRDAMVASLRRLSGCPAVNIKAGTNEGCDAIGRGEAIACHVVVLLALNH
jgi:2-C-methyl-D-erythritol 2,4-cyclodiphosphate synthase